MDAKMAGRGRGRALRRAVAALVAVAAPALVPAAAAPAGRCVTARVEAPFRLPDGALHPAGTLTLCDTREFSPVADLHVIRVDGRSAGIFLSRKQRAEASAGNVPQIFFEQDAGGRLDLVGFILPGAGRSTAFRLRGPTPAGGMRAGTDAAAAAGTAVAVTLAADTR